MILLLITLTIITAIYNYYYFTYFKYACIYYWIITIIIYTLFYNQSNDSLNIAIPTSAFKTVIFLVINFIFSYLIFKQKIKKIEQVHSSNSISVHIDHFFLNQKKIILYNYSSEMETTKIYPMTSFTTNKKYKTKYKLLFNNSSVQSVIQSIQITNNQAKAILNLM